MATAENEYYQTGKIGSLVEMKKWKYISALVILTAVVIGIAALSLPFDRVNSRSLRFGEVTKNRFPIFICRQEIDNLIRKLEEVQVLSHLSPAYPMPLAQVSLIVNHSPRSGQWNVSRGVGYAQIWSSWSLPEREASRIP
jgi:hypothetical protein